MSEVFIEMQRNGAYLKVTAIDPQTGTEASAMGPANDPGGVKRLAILKLQNKLKGNTPAPDGRGKLV
ncbi:DUF6898 family protein [Asticcacaulis benevestitus]|uniref:DUF6898 domain-containing protein n=1 Tax=Asticcacaulis benevestitus DSM 16100 = ATCC BAA-896 TaxID=1121022 RepID=V4PH03_9CAUL|nr:hypothetical protein [Asticcacaulis benevestitus]ESQ93202.1 hypothetical protein ABENE_06530 [Asticcacaulis benevestitus DSM 16100 = ATCC BAA-896]